ncbi:MAG: hypothetical protein JWP58_3274 [Hymenobacter sp.]|nr:hypothetical protein [Hymenobacter sp.]
MPNSLTTAQEIDALYLLIAQVIADNTTGDITPADMRQVLGALVAELAYVDARIAAVPPIGTGTAVTFDAARRWPLRTTGTYTVSAAGAAVDVCLQLILGVGASEITVPGTGFVKLSGNWAAGKTNYYSFLVGVDGLIQYYITQPAE